MRLGVGMRRRLTKAISIGLGLAGCGTRALPGGSDGGDTSTMTADDDGGEASIGGPTTSGTGATTGDHTSEAEVASDATASDGDDGVIFDVGGDPDVGTIGVDCNLEAEPPITLGTACEVTEYMNDSWVMICVPVPESGCEAADRIAVTDALTACYDPNGEYSCTGLYNSCGPIQDGDTSCCYWGTTGQTCPGRPFLVDGEARLADTTARRDWSERWPRATTPDPRLAQAWRFDARHEHAAIASFTRFAMELLALAAPARFVDAALRAARDELEHARLFFGFAAADGHHELGPTELDTRGALAHGSDEIAIVVATVREGCIAETISAMQLAAAQANASEVARRDALARVLAQELEHVELAWSFVAWSYARGGAGLRSAVELAFAQAWTCCPKGPEVEPHPDDAASWRAAGRITDRERQAIAVTTLRTIVGPAAREMFARAGVDVLPARV